MKEALFIYCHNPQKQISNALLELNIFVYFHFPLTFFELVLNHCLMKSLRKEKEFFDEKLKERKGIKTKLHS